MVTVCINKARGRKEEEGRGDGAPNGGLNGKPLATASKKTTKTRGSLPQPARTREESRCLRADHSPLGRFLRTKMASNGLTKISLPV